MSIAPEIEEFIVNIGAKAPARGDQIFEKWKKLFMRSNYFVFNEKFMIVKICRKKVQPFWGVGKKFIDCFNSTEDEYFLVLLVSPESGWVFTKREINNYIENKQWRLDSKGKDYKIYYPLLDRNSFYSKESFLGKLVITEKE